jgi:hypothetical protein
MKFNKIIALLILIFVSLTLVACGGTDCTAHTDSNGDGFCDTCTAPVEPEKTPCTTHVDNDKNGKCDECGEDVEPEKTPCTTHVDNDKNGKCDECDSEVKVEDNKTEFVVYVKDESGNAIEGVWVQICQGESCIAPREGTGADGKYSVKLLENGEDVKVKIIFADEAYEYNMDEYAATFGEGETELTVTLKKKIELTSYLINVSYSEIKDDVASEPVKVVGAVIDVYVGQTLVKTVTTDENGSATFELEAGTENVSIIIRDADVDTTLPSNRKDFPNGQTTLNVILTNDIDLPYVPF